MRGRVCNQRLLWLPIISPGSVLILSTTPHALPSDTLRKTEADWGMSAAVGTRHYPAAVARLRNNKHTFIFHRNSKNSPHVVVTITESAVYSWIIGLFDLWFQCDWEKASFHCVLWIHSVQKLWGQVLAIITTSQQFGHTLSHKVVNIVFQWCLEGMSSLVNYFSCGECNQTPDSQESWSLSRPVEGRTQSPQHLPSSPESRRIHWLDGHQ